MYSCTPALVYSCTPAFLYSLLYSLLYSPPSCTPHPPSCTPSRLPIPPPRHRRLVFCGAWRFDSGRFCPRIRSCPFLFEMPRSRPLGNLGDMAWRRRIYNILPQKSSTKNGIHRPAILFLAPALSCWLLGCLLPLMRFARPDRWSLLPVRAASHRHYPPDPAQRLIALF